MISRRQLVGGAIGFAAGVVAGKVLSFGGFRNVRAVATPVKPGVPEFGQADFALSLTKFQAEVSRALAANGQLPQEMNELYGMNVSCAAT